MIKLEDFLKSFVPKTHRERAELGLKDNERFLNGEVYRRVECDCQPPRRHGPHWRPARLLS